MPIYHMRARTCTRAHLYVDEATRAQNNSRISARSEFPRCPQNALINILSNAPCVSRANVKDGRRNTDALALCETDVGANAARLSEIYIWQRK